MLGGCQPVRDPKHLEAGAWHRSLRRDAEVFPLCLGQEEQQFQSLHKELNSLAQKLEKQGKNESRNVSARRKHLNKA